MKEFPVTEKQFISWLDEGMHKHIHYNPLEDAVNSIGDQVIIGDDDWCFFTDLQAGGNKNREYPSWCLKVLKTSVKIGPNVTRSTLKKELYG